MEAYNLLGVRVNPLTIAELLQLIARAIRHDANAIFANHNLHSVFLFHHDAKMRSFYDRAEYVYIDGMPLVFWARLLGRKLKPDHRSTMLDWILPLMASAAENNWRVFYLGGKAGVAEKARQKICGVFPALQLQTHHGFFELQGAPNQEVLAKIREFRPHVLLVGMGMPRQECWIIDNYQQITANAVLNAGACFDYLAGEVKTPPRWMGKIGLEWGYRLWHEPLRLWKRYLWEPWFILPFALEDLLRRFTGK